MEIGTFTCSICSEQSTDICVYCTKDACANHLCKRCKRCSDCCQCETTRGHEDEQLRERESHSVLPVEAELISSN